jgi:2-oxoglutarate dehydrogenase E1 component
MDNHSYMSSTDATFIDEMYQQFLNEPLSVEEGWRKFFEGFEFARTNFDAETQILNDKEFKVINLIHGYRTRGHLFTKTNPVRIRRKYTPTLDIENYDLEVTDLDTVFQAGKQTGIGPATLKEIIDHLERIYCETIGIEYMYMRNPEVINWFRDKIELKNRVQFTDQLKKGTLNKLGEAVGFEQFLHRKFVGQKRFSLEGAEVIIPALDAVVERGAGSGVKEVVIGMAHRGRLNVLANIFNKPFSNIFNEFEGKSFDEDLDFDGDVKYHLGHSTQIETNNGNVNMTLAPNPSHLEAVGPIVQGIARAKIDEQKLEEENILPIVIHGDAAVAGQGVVYEIIQMSQLEGYKTGGTIHIVINNQVGFTTNYLDARSSTYCTDVGKVTLSPVLHVNGDDVEAMIQAVQLALDYRQKYHKDVFIDLLCYRKYGHNEGDEPKFTQPLLYKIIAKHPNPAEIYRKKLIGQGVITAKDYEEAQDKYSQLLEEKLNKSKADNTTSIENFLADKWKGITSAVQADFEISPKTGVDKKQLLEVLQKTHNLPEDKKFVRKVVRLFDNRLKMIEEDKLDWALAEILAFGSLLQEGHQVRLSGQDVERGTFSHRHAVIKVEDSEEKYIPLNNLTEKQGEFSIYNSPLSEYGVLGFDYGYALASPQNLVAWEAQFGDFNNGAQIIIDQFLSSAEDKWKSQNGLVMLLPHGYEGQGAEHSSARLERFLTLSADLNMQIVNCTTPANFYHVLRRQLKRNFRKPLIVFTPKSLLRHPGCVSSISEFASGNFQEMIDDVTIKKAKTVCFCSGKIYYDLINKRKELSINDIAFIRIEQLYPLATKQWQKIINKYKKHRVSNWYWVQEEPLNMGAWTHIKCNISQIDLKVIAQHESASPATGSSQTHLKRINSIFDQVFSLSKQKRLR